MYQDPGAYLQAGELKKAAELAQPIIDIDQINVKYFAQKVAQIPKVECEYVGYGQVAYEYERGRFTQLEADVAAEKRETRAEYD